MSNATDARCCPSYVSHLSTRPSPSVSSSTASQDVVRVVLKAVGLTVPFCGDLDPDGRACRIGERPGILDTVIRPRKSYLLELLTWAVVLPAIDLSIAVAIDLDSNNASAIHIADSVKLTVSIGVVLQHFKLPGLLVVDRLELVRGRGQRRHKQRRLGHMPQS